MKRLILPFFMSVLFVLQGFSQGAQLHKLSPMLRRMVVDEQRNENSSYTKKPSLEKRQNSERIVCAFMRFSGDADRIMHDYGCRELAHVGNVYIVAVPVIKLGALTKEKGVDRIEARRGNHVMMDQTPGHLNALPAYAGTALPHAFTGRDVVVGVMDIGFDLTHPNFYDVTATKYRIKRLWDHISPDTIGSELFVGRDYTTQEELLALGCTYDGKIQTHGTHTLGLAAGSGYNSPYRGMAWESDLCLVNNATSEDISLINPDDYEKYTFATDALGFKYIFDYAEQEGKPCVISFSEGSPQDYYGYDVLYYELLQNLVGPGRILVASIGNQGNVSSYMKKEHGRQRVGTFLWSAVDRAEMTAKADAPFTFRTTVYADEPVVIDIPMQDVLAAEDSTFEDSILIGEKMFHYSVMAYPSCYIPSETCYDFQLQLFGQLGNVWPVSVEFIGEDSEIEVYRVLGEMIPHKLNPDLFDAECTHNIHSPSSAPCVIAVGATSYRQNIVNFKGETKHYDMGTNGERGSYSSVGPTFDGRIKPDVMAPGTNIISSYSSYYIENNPDASDVQWDVEHFDFQGRTYAWNSNAGTSMSTPVAAGAIALWMQAKPSMTPEDVLGVIARTSTHYDTSLSYPNNYWGYGQIDVYRGLLDILGIDGIEGLSTKQPVDVSVKPTVNRHIHITFDKVPDKPFTVKVFSTGGTLVRTLSFDGEDVSYDADLSQLPKGIYAVQIDTQYSATTGSTLVRL